MLRDNSLKNKFCLSFPLNSKLLLCIILVVNVIVTLFKSSVFFWPFVAFSILGPCWGTLWVLSLLFVPHRETSPTISLKWVLTLLAFSTLTLLLILICVSFHVGKYIYHIYMYICICIYVYMYMYLDWQYWSAGVAIWKPEQQRIKMVPGNV